MEKRGWMTVLLVFGGLFVALIAFSIVLVMTFGDGAGFGASKVGVVEIEGPITESKETLEDLRRFEDKESIKGIVVRINTPGGAVAPSQEIYQAVKSAKKEKTLVVSMGTTAASGGYYIACGADTIFANPGTITGSIGVITQLFNVQKLLDDIDVQVNTVKTGKFKDAGSPFKQFTEEQREYFMQLLQDIYKQFVQAVADNRGMEVERAKELADGRVFTGRQAKEKGLVDELGSMQDAVDHIEEKENLEEVELTYPPKDDLGFLSSVARQTSEQVVQQVSNSVSREVKSHSTPLFEYRYAGP
jgi:protease-4